MADFFKDKCTDKALENDGVKVYLPRFDCTITVCRTGNKKHVVLNDKLMKPYKQYQKNGTFVSIPDGIQKEIEAVTLRVYAETILVGFEGIEVDDKPFPYTIENAIRLLEDNDFFSDVHDAAKMPETFRRVAIENNAKNLGKVSSGS